MAERGQDAFLVYSSGILSILRPSYFYYVTDVRPAGPHSAALITRDGRTRLLVEPSWDAPRVASQTWLQDVRGSTDFVAELVATVRELCPSGRLFVAGVDEMPEVLYAALAEVAVLSSANSWVEDVARVKTPAELANIHEVGRIADLGFNAIIEAGRPGMREFELVAEMEYAMRCAGADETFILLSTGLHNDEMHEPTERVLERGDIIIGEITPVKDGQFIQLCRTVVLGRPEPKVVKAYDLLLKAFQESLVEVRPGVASGVISKAMNRVISTAGFGKFCYPPYMRARGHGFGVGSIAPGGAIDDDTRTPFEIGQAVVVHPNQYLEETGYLACGETVLVTKDGYERLAATDTRLYSVGE
jgi:Xaa-Pro aminopeptidase